MGLFVTLLFLIGFILIVIGYVKANKNCPPQKIEYRYVPRTFIEDQNEPVPVTDIFARMFYQSSPWLSHEAGKLLPPANLQQPIRQNKFFISQS